MKKIWFTSDTHFGSERTLQLSKRPFKSVQEMDNTMIDTWNGIVGKQDIVLHLGDFGNYETVKQLNGKVYLVFGNYERKDIKENFENSNYRFQKYLLELGFVGYFDSIYDQWIKQKINNEEYKIIFTHEPSKLPKEFIYDNDIHLFGHIHEKQMIKRFGLNVGVDCHNFKPIDLNTVLFYDNALKNFYDEEVFM